MTSPTPDPCTDGTCTKCGAALPEHPAEPPKASASDVFKAMIAAKRAKKSAPDAAPAAPTPA